MALLYDVWGVSPNMVKLYANFYKFNFFLISLFFIHAPTAKTTLEPKAHAVSIDAFWYKDVPFGGLIGNGSILGELGAENLHFEAPR